MSNFNQVILMGNLTRDPELSYTPGKTAVVVFGLAVNRKWKKQDGTDGEEVLFVDCQMYGKQAEVVSKHFTKGKSIFVQGRLKFEQWESGGNKHSRIRVLVENFEFIGKKD
ncbi:Single-stranded DNA-binding protein [subsurface metagenome]